MKLVNQSAMGMKFLKTFLWCAVFLATSSSSYSAPKSADSLLVKANTAYKQGKYDQAMDFLDEASALDPSNSLILTMKGSVFFVLGWKDLAEKYWKESLVLNPDQPDLQARFPNFKPEPIKPKQADASVGSVATETSRPAVINQTGDRVEMSIQSQSGNLVEPREAAYDFRQHTQRFRASGMRIQNGIWSRIGLSGAGFELSRSLFRNLSVSGKIGAAAETNPDTSFVPVFGIGLELPLHFSLGSVPDQFEFSPGVGAFAFPYEKGWKLVPVVSSRFDFFATSNFGFTVALSGNLDTGLAEAGLVIRP
ncbi:MAG: hypothetical protein AAB425_12045 [Bdellovibrionota bacterium]